LVLPMPSPYKHPKTGVYWYRQRVPASLGSLARGKSASVEIAGGVATITIGAELKVSLGTKDPKVAKERAQEAQAQFDLVWATFENAPVRLTLKQCVALSGQMYRLFKSILEDDPGEAGKWAQRRREWAAAEADSTPGPLGDLKIRPKRELRHQWGTWIDGELTARRLRVDEDTYARLLVEFDRAIGDLGLLLERRAGGDFGPDLIEQRFPAIELPVPHAPAVPAKAADELTLTSLLNHKEQTQSQRARTYDGYRSRVRSFAAFLGHEDARRITRDNIRDWRNHLQEQKLSAKTINDGYLTAVKAALSHGEDEFGIANVAAGIRDKRDAAGPTGRKDYAPEQAIRILQATFTQRDETLSIPHQRAVFWAPWIMAYTGLRVGEVTQFRGRNLRWEDGIPVMLITPEDGSTKGKAAWAVGIHDHLIDLGLLEMFRAVGDGPAFHLPYPAGTDLQALKDHRRDDASADVGTWTLAALGEAAPLGRPNHAWRHTFTTRSRGRMNKEARDFMMGSRSKVDAREGYGEWPPHVLHDEVNKLPRYEVEETSWRPPTELVEPAPLRTPRKPRPATSDI
jgi:integrase